MWRNEVFQCVSVCAQHGCTLIFESKSELLSRLSFRHLLTARLLTKVRQTQRRSVEDGGWQNSPWAWRTPPACGRTSGSSRLLAGLLRVSRCSLRRLHLTPSHRSPRTPRMTRVCRPHQVTNYTQRRTKMTWTFQTMALFFCLFVFLVFFIAEAVVWKYLDNKVYFSFPLHRVHRYFCWPELFFNPTDSP